MSSLRVRSLRSLHRRLGMTSTARSCRDLKMYASLPAARASKASAVGSLTLSTCVTAALAPVTSVIPVPTVSRATSIRAPPRAGGGHLPWKTLPGQRPVGQPSAPSVLPGGGREADIDNLEPISARPDTARRVIRRLHRPRLVTSHFLCSRRKPRRIPAATILRMLLVILLEAFCPGALPVLLRPLSPRLPLPIYVRLKRRSGLSRRLTRTLCFLLCCLPQHLQSEFRSRTHPGDDAASRTASTARRAEPDNARSPVPH